MIFNLFILAWCSWAVFLNNPIISRVFKLFVILCNILFLLVLISHSLKLSVYFSPSELYSMITEEERKIIFGGILFAVTKSFALSTATHKHIKKNIPQYLIYSVSYLTIYCGAIKGLDRNTILGVHPLTQIASLMFIVAIWNVIEPYWNKRGRNINQIVFGQILLTNVILVGYNIYFELTQFKILGLTSAWVMLFFWATFWQVCSLDTEKNLPLVGNYLNTISFRCRRMLNDYFPRRR